ncbi:hypothetical protein TSMEX_000958, partial [Taenia solium]
ENKAEVKDQKLGSSSKVGEVDKGKHPNEGTVAKHAGFLQLTEGDKFQLNTSIPLDARQLKNNKLWWTKNGKPLVDVDGPTPRSAKFVSKSSYKSPGPTGVELIKKDLVSVEDAATYVLMGEPRIKRGFKPQETAYATIVVSVIEKPKVDVDEVGEEPAAAAVAVEEKRNEPGKEVSEVEEAPKEQEVDVIRLKKAKDKGEDSEEEYIKAKKESI